MQNDSHAELCTGNGQKLSYLLVEESAILKCRFLNEKNLKALEISHHKISLKYYVDQNSFL